MTAPSLHTALSAVALQTGIQQTVTGQIGASEALLLHATLRRDLLNDAERTALSAALLETSTLAAPPDSDLYLRIMAALGPASPFERHRHEGDLADQYTGDVPRDVDRENASHVGRLLARTHEMAAVARLTYREFFALRDGILYSDLGKRNEITQEEGTLGRRLSRLRKHLAGKTERALRRIEPKEDSPITGLVHWLRLYQTRVGLPLQFQPEALSKLTAAQRGWGTAPFPVREESGPVTPAEWHEALRLWMILYGSGPIDFFPLGLLFHELPGFMIAAAMGAPPPVLGVIAFHNGPVRRPLRDDSPLPPVGDFVAEIPFWQWLAETYLVGGYPNPRPGDLLSLLHILLDRTDQGQLLTTTEGMLVGGPRKILIERLTTQAEHPLNSVREAIRVPARTRVQVEILWEAGIRGTALEARVLPLYRQTLERLDATTRLFDAIDFDRSSADQIRFRNGSTLAVPQEFIPGTSRLTLSAAEQFARDLFARLADRMPG